MTETLTSGNKLMVAPPPKGFKLHIKSFAPCEGVTVTKSMREAFEKRRRGKK